MLSFLRPRDVDRRMWRRLSTLGPPLWTIQGNKDSRQDKARGLGRRPLPFLWLRLGDLVHLDPFSPNELVPSKQSLSLGQIPLQLGFRSTMGEPWQLHPLLKVNDDELHEVCVAVLGTRHLRYCYFHHEELIVSSSGFLENELSTSRP